MNKQYTRCNKDVNKMFFTVFISCATHILCQVAEPSGHAYPVEGTSFEAKCFGKGASHADLKFIQSDNSPVTTDLAKDRMNITSSNERNVAVKILVVNPVYLNDTFLQGMVCSDGAISHQLNIKILPRDSIPKITITPNTLTGSEGNEQSLQCKITITKLVPPVKGVVAKWKFNEFDDTTLRKDYSAHYVIADGPDNSATNQISTLTIKSLALSNVGTYFCYGELQLEGETIPKTFYQTANITSVSTGDIKEGKQEVESKAGKDATMLCPMSGFPFPTIIWKKGNTLIDASTDSRYLFTARTNSPPRSMFKLTDVTYEDRATYTCVAEYTSVNRKSQKARIITQEFQLRVRDPLGPLWPTIGIFVEVIILFVIIGLYELCKKHHKTVKKKKYFSQKEEDDRNQKEGPDLKMTEDFHLLNQGKHVVTYHSEEGVRTRNNRENAVHT